ncbi:MAG TPA: DUF1194 domain-containing protein [Thermohalobaculum sp.]|nr:DUF1194 domain-containing protein [Thermohalobaculum sp.]
MRARLAIVSILAACAACTLGPAALAQGELEVDVELVLAVDVSRSMTPRELEIQRRGYAEALVSDEVVSAIRNGMLGRVALAYVEWAGEQRVVVDWTLVRDRAGAEAFAGQLTAVFDSSLRRTSISGALDFAATLFDGNGFTGLRRVIDVSGDGPNNQGRPVAAARDAVLARGIVINGLPLMTREGMGSQWHLQDLDEYYRHCVIGGPAAFVIPVLEWRHFPQAVRRKLVLEIASRPAHPPAHPTAPHDRVRPAAADYDCLIGERIWRDMQNDWN